MKTRNTRPSLTFETLEGKALLSQMAYTPSMGSGAAIELRARADDHGNHGGGDDHGQLSRPGEHGHVFGVSGFVFKAPKFYEFYTGPKNADLNVVAASAQLVPNRSLTLMGVMAGRIVKNPTTTDQQSFYVFGIDRHSPNAVTPFFQRPGITFDAVVVVSVQTTGTTASVTDLTTGKSTPLDPSAVHISGRQVSVTVDPSLLPTPAGGVDLAHSSFNLWPRNSLSNAVQPNHGSTVASFAPENAVARIGVVGRFHFGF